MRDLSQRFQTSFADQLRRGLRASGVRQIDLATALNVSELQVSKWGTGTLLPSQSHLPGIEHELRLNTGNTEDLHAAWQRETHHIPANLAPPSERPDMLIADLVAFIETVKALRLAGQARIAMQLANRERERVLLHSSRFKLSDTTRKQIMRYTSALVLEQCKAALDFMPRANVRAGALAEEILLLREIADYCQSTETRFASVLSLEAATYVSGDVTNSLRQTRELLQQAAHIPEQWFVEVLRAAAINAGMAADHEALTDVHHRVDHYLATCRAEITSDQTAFLLEGLARGLGALDAGRADEVMQRAWIASGAEDREGSGSTLRYVQLARTDAEISLDGDRRPSLDLGRRVSTALRISRQQGYDRYVDQLTVLERRIGGENTRF